MPAADQLAENTIAVLLAGGEGTRLGPLTRNICKPALPFGAAYRNIDFSLSNCVNSGIRRIGIATQHKPDVLVRHVKDVWERVPNGKDEFIALWPSDDVAPVTGYRGTADAVFRNLGRIEQQDPACVLVLAGDHVYRMDYRPMLEFHRRRQADVTVGCIEVPPDEASQYGIVAVDPGGRVEQFVEKPKGRDELPDGDCVLASMGIYVFEAGFLARTLRKDSFSSESSHDFGRDILPLLTSQADVRAYPFVRGDGAKPGYWRDVGTPAAYWRAHLELLDDVPGLRLDDPEWPVPTAWSASSARRLRESQGADGGRRSLIAEDCRVDGVVNRSVLFPGVEVSAGSLVESSVVLPGAVIGRNCRIRGAVVDSDCRIPDGTVIDPATRTGETADKQLPVIVTADAFAPALVHAIA